MLPPRLCALALSLAAAACTPVEWVKPDAGPEQLDQDLVQCRQEAWREAQWRSFLYRPIGPVSWRDAQGRRFFGWPASPFGDPYGDRFMEESRLEHFCMRSKGYDLAPVDKK